MLLDEKFLLLWENYESKNSDFRNSYDPFKFENMDETECKTEFRVKKWPPQTCSGP